ncbi:hypothetical protein KLP28_15490 [Nocardioidaceae bacterium]|nr:hypothetical protein KLP28_15490 [Nocardioidaceae bacterium]
MIRTRHRAPAARAAVAALAVLLPLSACGSDTEEPQNASGTASPTSSASETPSPSPSADATATPTDAASEDTPSPSPASDPGTGSGEEPAAGQEGQEGVAPAPGAPTPTGGRYGRLLDAGELPGFGDDWAWSEFETVPRDRGPFTVCQRFSFSDIGATGVVVRRFDAAVPGADGDTAGQAVATFPDAKQARQALSVFESWAEDCQTSQSGIDAEVSRWTKVQVPDATAYWYAARINSSSPEEARTERVTVVQRGPRLAVVRTQLLGDEREYPAAQDPAALTATPTASKLGG